MNSAKNRVLGHQSEMSFALSVMFFAGAIFAFMTAAVFPAESGASWFRVILVSGAALISGLGVMIAGNKLSSRSAGIIGIAFIIILLILTALSVTALRGVVWGLMIVVLIVFFAWFMPLANARLVSYCSLITFSVVLSVRYPSSDVYLMCFVICLLTFGLIEVFGKFKQDLQKVTLTDHLCQVWNRAGLELMLQREIRVAERANTQLALLYVDLDGFKQINDKRGHLAGDRILQAVAMSLRTNVRPTDTVARVGGDEFVLLLPDTGAKAAEMLATRLRVTVTECKWTYGVAEYSRGESVTDFLDRSDREMLVWKRSRSPKNTQRSVSE